MKLILKNRGYGLIVAMVCLFCVFAFGPASLSAATADVDVTGAVDNLGATWSAIKTAALGILGFLLAIALLKKGYRRVT